MHQTPWHSESAETDRHRMAGRFQHGLALAICVLTALDGGGSEPPEKSGDDPARTDIQLVPVESVDAATRSMWLIDGTVIDADTSEKIKKFTVTPGSLSTDESGKSTIRWRSNLKREMTDGRLRWPRTSGFSVMRFQVTADSYVPITTQRIWRGGPHTRIVVRMKQTKEISTSPSP